MVIEEKEESQTGETRHRQGMRKGSIPPGIAVVAAALSMFLVIIAMLLTSFQTAIYGDAGYGFYEKEYAKYHVTDSLGMEMEDVMDVTEYMMDYLIGKEEELSIVTDVDGRRQDFFNEQDRLHMADVRNLFLGGLRIRNICAAAALLLILGLKLGKADLKRLIPRAYFRAVLIFVALILFLGLACMIDFTACFTLFHKIFFTNDLWMFNPASDYMIRMLPEGFFSDMALRIVGTFIGMLAALGIVLAIWKGRLRPQNPVSCHKVI